MKPFFILFAAVTSVLAAPEAGYKYNNNNQAPPLPPVIEHGNLKGFQPITPCIHAAQNHHGDSLVQSQSHGRILNHQQQQHQHGSLESAASGYSPQSQAVTVNSHIVVGDSGTAASSFSAGSQEFRPGQGYAQAQPQQPTVQQPSFQPPQPQFQQPQFQPPQFQPPPPQFNPLPQLPPQLPAQLFNPGGLPPGRVVPSQVISGQTQGYAYAQGGGAAAPQHIHHHYTAGGGGGGGAIINGVGRVPPPPSFPVHNGGDGQQYAPSFSGNRFVGPPQASYGAPANFAGPVSYRPAGPGPIGNIGAPRPVQHFGSASNAFGSSNSNSYAGSFSHNAHNVQNSGAQHFGGNNANFGAAAQGGASFNSGAAALFNTATSAASHNNALSGQLGHVIRETFANAPLDPTVEKHIYVHVPPEDLEENGKHAASELLPQVQTKKHYKIIFIKAPTVAQPNYAQLAAATQQSEEKTLVYVLVKKPDEPSFEEIQQIQQTAVKSSKPEVYFIKYKTRKENEAPAYTTNTQFAAGGGGGDQFGANNQFANIGGGGYNSVLENNNSGGGYSSNAGSEVDGSGNIDIRLNGGGGESNGVSTSTSYSTSSSSSSAPSGGLNIGESSGPKHELYGVPLE